MQEVKQVVNEANKVTTKEVKEVNGVTIETFLSQYPIIQTETLERETGLNVEGFEGYCLVKEVLKSKVTNIEGNKIVTTETETQIGLLLKKEGVEPIKFVGGNDYFLDTANNTFKKYINVGGKISEALKEGVKSKEVSEAKKETKGEIKGEIYSPSYCFKIALRKMKQNGKFAKLFKKGEALDTLQLPTILPYINAARRERFNGGETAIFTPLAFVDFITKYLSDTTNK
jgi:hypothetical protein